MFEFRLRILDARERETDPNSFLGIVEGFPQVLVHATTVEQAERDLADALAEHLKRMQDHEATRLELDDYPTVRTLRVFVLASSVGDLSATTKRAKDTRVRARAPSQI